MDKEKQKAWQIMNSAGNYIVNKEFIKDLNELMQMRTSYISDSDKSRVLVRCLSDAVIFESDNKDDSSPDDRSSLISEARCCLSHLCNDLYRSNIEYSMAIDDIRTLFERSFWRKEWELERLFPEREGQEFESCDVDFSRHKFGKEQRYAIADQVTRAVLSTNLSPKQWLNLWDWNSAIDRLCIVNTLRTGADDPESAMRHLAEFRKKLGLGP